MSASPPTTQGIGGTTTTENSVTTTIAHADLVSIYGCYITIPPSNTTFDYHCSFQLTSTFIGNVQFTVLENVVISIVQGTSAQLVSSITVSSQAFVPALCPGCTATYTVPAVATLVNADGSPRNATAPYTVGESIRI